MKNSIVMILMVLSLMVFGQNKTESIDPKGAISYIFNARDIMEESSIYYITAAVNTEYPWSYDFIGTLHKVSGTPAMKILAEYRLTDIGSWVVLDSVEIEPMQSSDTVISDYRHYKIYATYLRLRVVTTDSIQTSRFTNLVIKTWNENTEQGN